MGKKITAKVQRLNPALKEKVDGFASCVVVKPEDEVQILQKGIVYTAFEVLSDAPLDVSLILKAVTDVLYDSYYSSENVSPVQSLEKAILSVRDRVGSLSGSSSVLRDSSIEFNVISAVLWGNVLYIVQYGRGEAYLVDRKGVSPVDFVGEGNFLVSSRMVRDDDVVILCTESFVKKYPPERLLSSPINESDLTKRQACILLKFISEGEGSEETGHNPINVGEKAPFDVFAGNISRLVKIKQPMIELKLPFKTKSKSKSGKENIVLRFNPLFIFVFLIFIGFGLFILKEENILSKFIKKESSLLSNIPLNSDEGDTSEPNKKDGSGDTSKTGDDKKTDEQNKVKRVTVEDVLYDLKISDASANPGDIAMYEKKIVVSDTGGKIYTSLIGDFKFLPIKETFFGVHNILIDSTGIMTFLDNSGVRVYDLNTEELKNSYSTIIKSPCDVYSDFIYAFEDNKIVKYTKKDTTLEASTWGESNDFKDAKHIVVAYSIYVATKDNNLVKYTSGVKDSFEITGLDTPFRDIVKIVAKTDFKNIYIADKGNARVVVLNTSGSLSKQYKFDETSVWNDLKSITVSSDEKTMYVLSGSKVYEISL